MPTSQKPRRPFAGNTILIQSKEYQQLLAQMGYLNQQISLLQAVVGAMVREQQAEAKAVPEALRTATDVPQEVWDEYERDTAHLALAGYEQDRSGTNTGLNAPPIEVTAAANEDTYQDPSIAGIV